MALHERDDLIELLDTGPSAHDVVAFLTRRFAPRQLANTEGDPLVFCEGTVHTDGPAALATALDMAFDRDDDGDPQWIEHITTHGMERIRALLRLDGEDLRIKANSEERYERVLRTVRELDPSATIVTDTRTPARDEREAAEAAERGILLTGARPTGDPDEDEIFERFILDYERKWLDDELPALGNHTPRQAAADPTRREDLIKLLDSLPPARGPGLMNPDRLRAALGLDGGDGSTTA